MKYMKEKKGQLGGVNLILPLIMAVGVGVLLLIFTTTLSAQTYNLVEPNINNISNETVKTAVKDAIVYGFDAQKLTAQYIPIIVLASIIVIVVGLVIGISSMSRMGGGGGVL